jgi:hypothetical protein
MLHTDRRVMSNGTAMRLQLTRSETVLRPDPARVLLRQFEPGYPERITSIMDRVLAIPEVQLEALLKQVYADFTHRHTHLQHRLLRRFEQVASLVPVGTDCSHEATPDRLLFSRGVCIGIGRLVQSFYCANIASGPSFLIWMIRRT